MNRPVFVNYTIEFPNYLRAIDEIINGDTKPFEGLFPISRLLAQKAMGGIEIGTDLKTQYLFVTDGERIYSRPRGGNTDGAGPVSFQVNPDTPYTSSGNIIAQVEPRDSNLLDRGLAWIALPRNELEYPTFTVGLHQPQSSMSINEINDRIIEAELAATKLLNDMLNGAELPSFAS